MPTHITIDANRNRLRVQGDLSAATGEELYTAVQTLYAAPPAEVVIDLSAVPRMDSLGGAWLTRTADGLRPRATGRARVRPSP